MNNDTITDYIFQRLSETERLDFERAMAANDALRQEVGELKKVWKLLKNAEPAADEALDNSFYKLLEEEKGNSKRPVIALKPRINWGNWARYAAVVASIVGAFWAGRQTASPPIEYQTIAAVLPPKTAAIDVPKAPAIVEQKPQKEAIALKESSPAVVKQIAELRKEMQMTQELVVLSLLKDESASARLKGLSYATALNQPANVVIEALIKTLREDESVNVRLSAIEALERFKIKGVLVGQLAQSTEPIEQLTLIETLLRLRAKESLPALKQLEEDPNTDQSVRLAARNGIDELRVEI
ncbi:MAG: HEAT repeat domain-containing protein [Runella slithyformis]|nr:MAG: HEAT repeat domain-containing protein [Runella slithyformis]